MDKNIRIHLFKLMAFKLYVTPFFRYLFLERMKKIKLNLKWKLRDER